MWVVDFLKSCLATVLRRGAIFAVLNALYFCVIFGVALLNSYLYPQPPYEGVPADVPEFLVAVDWPILFVGIFLFNLVASGFFVVTLPGLVFFPLSVVLLLYRGFVWGLLLSLLPTAYFLGVLPTIVLEGEGYVLASVAGVLLGLSWVKPDWAYRGEGLSRLEAFRKALRESGRIYVVVASVLLVAAIAETVTIAYLR